MNSTDTANKGMIIVLSGPSGAGKGTLYKIVTEALPDIGKSISVTTREPRDGEIDGVHYHFRTEDEYDRMLDGGEFLEHAGVYGHRYGSPLAPVEKMLADGKDIIFEIDIAGSRQIKEKFPECLAVFIMTPSFEILAERLRGRHSETVQSLEMRLGSAKSELAQYGLFDYIVFNDVAKDAAGQILDIIRAVKAGDTECVSKHTIAANLTRINDLLKQ